MYLEDSGRAIIVGLDLFRGCIGIRELRWLDLSNPENQMCYGRVTTLFCISR